MWMETIAVANDALQVAQTVAADIPGGGSPEAPPGLDGPMDTLINWGKWIALGIAVLALVIFGGGLAINYRRGDNGADIGGIMRIVLGVAVIASAFTIVGFIFEAV